MALNTQDDITKLRQNRRIVYSTQSESASKVMRQLLIGGLGFVWLLLSQRDNLEAAGVSEMDYPLLKWVLLCMSLALIFDLLHRVISVAIYQYYAQDSKLTKATSKGEIDISEIGPKEMRVPWALFYAKILLTLISFVLLCIVIL